MTAVIQDDFEATMLMACPEPYRRIRINQVQMKAICELNEALDSGTLNKQTFSCAVDAHSRKATAACFHIEKNTVMIDFVGDARLGVQTLASHG